MMVFINNKFLPQNDASICINDRGLLLGDGIFETMKSLEGKIPHYDKHITRLKNSAHNFGLDLGLCHVDIMKIITKLFNLNKLEKETASIRITITRGISSNRDITIPRICQPTLFITTAFWERKPVYYPKAYITSIKRNEYSPTIQHKTLNYLEQILARKEAKENQFDEGIMLNTKGFVTETSTANLFFIKHNQIITPRISDGILPGIVRQFIFEICKTLNIQVIEKEIHPEEISQISGAFITNSLIDIQPLSFINNHELSDIPMIKKLQQSYKKLTMLNERELL